MDSKRQELWRDVQIAGLGVVFVLLTGLLDAVLTEPLIHPLRVWATFIALLAMIAAVVLATVRRERPAGCHCADALKPQLDEIAETLQSMRDGRDDG